MTPVKIIMISLSLYGYASSITSFTCDYWEDEFSYIHADCSRRHLKLVPVVLSNVSFLDLSRNLITALENKTFVYLGILQELNLEANMLKWLEQKAFFGLQSLKRLFLGFNFLMYNSQHYSMSVFKPLKSLTYLDIGFERILTKELDLNFVWFSKYVISDLTSLQSIVIDFRCINTEYVFREGFMLLTKLTNVQAGNCCIKLTNETFLNVPNLEKLDLSVCQIFSYEMGTLRGRQLKYLNLHSVVPCDDRIVGILHDLNKSSIQTLVLTDTKYVIFDITYILIVLNKTTSLQNLYLNNHSIKMVICTSSEYALPSTLKNLDISYNDLRSVCLFMPKLESLNLEHNDLGDFLRSNTYYSNDPNSYPTNLMVINLSYNSLDNLNVSIFKGHRYLRNLNMSNNFLTDINFDISHLKLLRILDLSNNKIQKFSSESMKKLNDVFDLTDIRIRLAGNILQCTCEAIEFIKWILEKNVFFSEKNLLKCKFVNGTEVFLTEFRLTMSQLKKNCASRFVLIICISVVITLTIIVLTCGIVHRYRWRLRYIYYMTKSKYTQANSAQNDDRKFTYDAFISYSDNEDNFIIQECIPFLEEKYNFQLCIHKRDFLPGNEISYNITTAIHESRNVICIITKSFLESYYCMFEFNMARMESIYSRNGKNMLFLVFYEQIRARDLPLVILELVERDSYIEYPNDEHGNIVFWKKLTEAIK